jgi:UDP-N-acetylglucosamine acyltransferase
MNTIIQPCYIEAGAKIGDGCLIGPFVTIAGCVKIGNSCEIGACTVIGTPPQHTERGPNYGGVVIGDNVKIREHVTIHAALKPDHSTIIENGCHIFAGAHVGHDCHIEEKVILTAPRLAGHTHVMKTANLGLGAITHQFTTIGTGAMIGCGAVVVKDVPPYRKAVGNPIRDIGENTYLSKKVSLQYIQSETERFDKLRAKERGSRLLQVSGTSDD